MSALPHLSQTSCTILVPLKTWKSLSSRCSRTNASCSLFWKICKPVPLTHRKAIWKGSERIQCILPFWESLRDISAAPLCSASKISSCRALHYPSSRSSGTVFSLHPYFWGSKVTTSWFMNSHPTCRDFISWFLWVILWRSRSSELPLVSYDAAKRWSAVLVFPLLATC